MKTTQSHTTDSSIWVTTNTQTKRRNHSRNSLFTQMFSCHFPFLKGQDRVSRQAVMGRREDRTRAKISGHPEHCCPSCLEHWPHGHRLWHSMICLKDSFTMKRKREWCDIWCAGYTVTEVKVYTQIINAHKRSTWPHNHHHQLLWTHRPPSYFLTHTHFVLTVSKVMCCMKTWQF